MTDAIVKPIRNTRRDFLGKVGLIGAGALLGACAPTIAQPVPKADIDVAVLNFALNLEYLEAAFYLAAVGRLQELTAAGGDASKVALPAAYVASATNGVGIASLSAPGRAYATEIANDELAHVKFLRGALGAAAVPQPRLDLDAAFKTAGSVASGGAITGFDPFANELFFLHGSFVFEDVGVTAYKGAAPLLTNAGTLEAAAGILAVEAYHAGIIRTLLYQQKDVVVAGALKVSDVVQAISNLRDTADGTTDLDQGIVGGEGNPSFVAAGSANLVPTDANSIAFSRTTRQVLNIVYLDKDASNTSTKGGFFPDGLNGAITK